MCPTRQSIGSPNSVLASAVWCPQRCAPRQPVTLRVGPHMNWLKTLTRGTREARKHSTIPENRAITVAEADFIRWMLSHGNERSRRFLPQVDQARVVGRCTCGCTSIDLAIGGVTHYPHAGMETLCAFRWTAVEGEFEVYAFACGDLLAGIDLWTVWGQYPATYLPSTSLLVPAPSGVSPQGSGE